jgi:ankyrin repeat protein
LWILAGDPEAVELLLEYTADVDAVGSCGTPLHCAATKNHAATIMILLNYNADVSF